MGLQRKKNISDPNLQRFNDRRRRGYLAKPLNYARKTRIVVCASVPIYTINNIVFARATVFDVS